MRVHDYQKGSRCAHPERDEALFAEGVRVFPGKGIVVREHGCGLGKGDAVRADVGFSLLRIPVNFHMWDCMDKRHLRQVLWRAVEGVWRVLWRVLWRVCGGCPPPYENLRRGSSSVTWKPGVKLPP